MRNRNSAPSAALVLCALAGLLSSSAACDTTTGALIAGDSATLSFTASDTSQSATFRFFVRQDQSEGFSAPMRLTVDIPLGQGDFDVTVTPSGGSPISAGAPTRTTVQGQDIDQYNVDLGNANSDCTSGSSCALPFTVEVARADMNTGTFDALVGISALVTGPDVTQTGVSFEFD